MSSRIAEYLREDFDLAAAPGVVEWCERNLVLPAKMAPNSSGPFSTRRRPMMRPIMECGHPQSGVRNLTITAGSQFAKTTIGTLITAYRIANSPMPQLILGPAEDWLGVEISEKRLMALINENAVLRAHKPYDHNRFRKLAMEMSGGFITFEGINSNTSTSGSTQGIVWICEAAKIEHHKNEQAPEAHPIKLAFERTKEFRGLELHMMDFTPNSPHHLAWKTYERGTQTHFYVPCPHCKEYFAMEFELRREGELETILEESQEEAKPDYYRSLIWNPDARRKDGSWNMNRVRETVRYICPHHGCEIIDEDKAGMIDRFEEKHHNLNAPMSDRSFRAPSFYAPRVGFGDMAEQFLSRGDLLTTGLQNFYNSWLALSWSALSKNVKEQHVLALRGDYARRVLPSKPALMIFAADPGERATHWVVVAVLPTGEMFLIDWGSETSPKNFLTREFIEKRGYTIAGTEDRRFPDIGYIDSGDATEEIYNVCEASRGFLWPTKGDSKAFGSWRETTAASRPRLRLYTYSDTQLKDDLYGRLVYGKKEPRLWLPADVTTDVVLGLSGQQKDRATGKWKELPNDHYGDCVKLALLGKQIGRTFLEQVR